MRGFIVIHFTCPCCGGEVTVPVEWSGKEYACPDCGRLTLLTDNSTVAAPAKRSPPAQELEEPTSVTCPSDTVPAALPSISGYEILGELGRGGMGVVYRARQVALNRSVALKMVLADAHAGPAALHRFRAEAQAVARLQHPNIVQVYEVGEHGGRPYFSLELVEGCTLADRLAGTPLPAHAAAELTERLARAIHAAHERGVIHRDLKPANILLQARGSLPVGLDTPKITDFGLAKQVDGDSNLTRTGAVLGTPSYMAPEQAAGRAKEIGPAADIYALGATLYELLTGRPPLKGASPMDTLLMVMGDEPVPPSRLNPKVPRDLETICLKCLQKEIGRRYGSRGSTRR